MKKYFLSILSSLFLSLFICIVSNYKIDAGSLSLREETEYNSGYSFSFESSKIYNKYEVSYLMYAKDADKYFTHTSTFDTSSSFRNEVQYVNIPFNKFKESQSDVTLTEDILSIEVRMIKKDSCGFQNMEKNCLVDKVSGFININFPTPTTSTPINNSVFHEQNVTLYSNSVDIEAYYYKNSNDENYTRNENGALSNISWGDYTWYVRNKWGKISEVSSFSCIELDTTKPTNISPANNSVINVNHTTLVASDNKEIKEYYYREINTNDYIVSTDGNLTNLKDETTYEWYSVDTSSNNSEVFKFTYMSPDTTKPVGSYPVNNEKITKLPLTLTASDNRGIKEYYYREINTKNFILSTNGILNSLKDETTYEWYVVDTSSNNSETYTFYVYLDDVTKPTNVSPSNDSIIDVNYVTLVASDNRGIKEYYYKEFNANDYIVSTDGNLTNLKDETTYKWYSVDTSSNRSEIFTFTYMSPDVTKPTLVSPENGAVIIADSVTLVASDNREVKDYFLRKQGKESFWETKPLLENLIDGMTYEWFATDTSSNSSEIYTFTYYTVDRTNPVNVSPIDNDIINVNHVTLVANDNRGIKEYYYREINTDDFILSTDGNLTNLKDETTYEWYSVDTSSNSSAIFKFTYLSPDITKPMLISPINNVIVTTKTVPLIAEDNRGISSYYYKKIDDTSWSFSINNEITVEDYTTYQWYAIDTSSNESEIATFKVELVDSQNPTNVSPAYNAKINALSVQLSATDDKAIKYYAYRISDDRTWKTSSTGLINVKDGCEYAWFAVDYVGNQSDTFTFKVVLDDSTNPTIIFPENGAIVNNSYVELKATDNKGIKAYYLGKSRSSLRSLDNQYAASLENNTKYYWYAIDYAGNKTDTYTFTTSYTDSTMKNIYPLDGEIINTNKFYFTVSATSTIKEYYYQYDGASYWEKSYNSEMDRLNYGMKYHWYAVDENGNQSATTSFTFMYKDSLNPDGITILSPEDETYINTTSFTIKGSAVAGISYYRYWKSSNKNYTTCIDDDGNCTIRSLKNGDVIHFTVVDELLSWGEYRTVYVDLEAPEAGSIESTSSDPLNIQIKVGSDNIGAKYYYRVNYKEWIEYTENVTLTYSDRGSYIVETKAIDKAGNETINSAAYSIGIVLETPTINVISGTTGRWTNNDIVVEITPMNNHTNYYCIDDKCTLINEVTTITLSSEQNSVLYTKTTDDGLYYFTSTSLNIKIDKTKPVIGELYYREDRYNFNSSYEYILVDKESIVENTNEYTIYYKFRDIDSDWKEYTLSRVPLYQYIITISGTYYVDILLRDAAGNESDIKTATILIDVEGPSVNIYSKPTLNVEYDSNRKPIKWTIKIPDITDDYGYIYHFHYQMWDQNAYDNNLDSVINISYYTEGDTDYFEYDATNLSNTTWYFLLYVCDNYINCSYSKLYTFTKTDNGPISGGGGSSSTLSTKTYDYNAYQVFIGLALGVLMAKKKMSI